MQYHKNRKSATEMNLTASRSCACTDLLVLNMSATVMLRICFFSLSLIAHQMPRVAAQLQDSLKILF